MKLCKYCGCYPCFCGRSITEADTEEQVNNSLTEESED